jgi:hypothetical protein
MSKQIKTLFSVIFHALEASGRSRARKYITYYKETGVWK